MDALIQYIQQSGIFGPALMFLVFLIQAVVPLIPYALLAIAAGAVYGNLAGFFLAWTGAVLGTSFVYFFTRYSGRDYFRRRIEDRYAFNIDSMNALTLFGFLFLLRIFPIIPLPIVNICSGLGGVSWRTFVSAAALGTMPWAFTFTFLGNYASISNDITTILKYVVLILVVILTGAYALRRKIPIWKK